MKTSNSIPRSFKLFATTVQVVFDNKRMDDLKAYGYWHPSESKITLSLMDGPAIIPEDKIADTFYHEKVHAILDTMHEYKLSRNEKFVDTFAKLLRQADETAEYGNETRKDTREFDFNSPNGKLMVAVCSEIIKRQAERMYSEKEVLDILYCHTEDLMAGRKVSLERWFNQFKKMRKWEINKQQ